MCKNPAKYRFTWPGKYESFICKEHIGKLRAVVNAMGFPLQIIPLSEEELKMGLKCKQKGS